MNRIPLNHQTQTLIKSIPKTHLPNPPKPNSIINPLYNLLPNTQNPNKIVEIICTNLKLKNPTILDQEMTHHLTTQDITRVLLRCQSDSFSAFTFFNWVKNDLSLIPSLHDYCIMLHILAWSCNFSHTMNLLAELIELNVGKGRKVSIFEKLVVCSKDCSWDPVVFDMLLKSYLKAGLVRDGFVTFRKMVKAGFVPKVVTVNFLLDGLLKLNRIDECWWIYEEMRKIGVRGNTFTFNILTNVMCKSEDCDKVNEFLEKMEEGFDPDIVTYNTLIDSYVRKKRLKDALYLYNIMYIRRVIPDLITHTSLINGLCKEGNVKEAHKLLYRMVQIGLNPDVFCYNTLICGYVNKGMMQEARSLLLDMIKEKVFPNEFTCLVLVEGYRKTKMLISAVNLIVELQRFGLTVSKDLQFDLVIDLCTVDKPFAAKSLWKRTMQDEKEEPKLEIFNELVVSFCKLDYVNEAIQIKDEMFFKNINPNLLIYREIIGCLCRLNRTMEGEAFMRDMAEFGIQPDTTICRCLISGHCKERNFNQAELLLSLFAKDFQLHDNECYNEVFKAVCEEGDTGKLMEFQNRMQKVGFTPNSVSFKYAVDGMSRAIACRDACTVDSGSNCHLDDPL